MQMIPPSPFRAKSGLVSISFRNLAPTRIIELATANRLQSIEWGGDVHVPHGDIAVAQQVRRQCADAGIEISAYGSYYRAAMSERSLSFEAVLDSAVALGAPSIRVWAGALASAAADAEMRSRVADDLLHIATLAAAQGIRIALEYHGGTLTDTPESTIALLQAANHPNLHSYWQPRHSLTIEEAARDIDQLGRYLDNVHVFHWWPDSNTRLPLADGMDRWNRYLEKIKSLGGDHIFSLEFVRKDDPDQLIADANALHTLLAQQLQTDDTAR